jgi:hypothetical protein
MYVCLSVRLSSYLFVRMEQLELHCKNFYEILYLNIFLKFVDKDQISLISDNSDGFITWIPT